MPFDDDGEGKRLAMSDGPQTILVTGATGFIGRQLCARLVDDGFTVRCIVRAVGDRPDGGERHAVVVAHLRDCRAFHLDRQRVGQREAQRGAFGVRRDEPVAAHDQTAVHARRSQAKRPRRVSAEQGGRIAQHLVRGGLQPIAERGVGRKAGQPGQRHFVPRKDRRGIEIVLQQLGRDDDIADRDARRQPARDTGEHHGAAPEALHQHRGRGRRRHLADARQHRHHRPVFEMPAPELAPRGAHRLLVGHAREQRAELFVHRGDDGDRRHDAARVT